jgi:hypothetical protein
MVQTQSASGQLRTTHITHTRSDNGGAATDCQSHTIAKKRTVVTFTTTKLTAVKRKAITSSELNVSSVSSLRTHPTVYIVFVSLLLDLLAFTMILPLLPSLLDHYRLNDSPNGLYPWLLGKVRYFQEFVGAPDRFNSVLFGGKWKYALIK